MPLHLFRIEGRDDIRWPDPDEVEALIDTFGAPDGPTFVLLFGPDEEYVQAAGSAGVRVSAALEDALTGWIDRGGKA